MLFFLFLTNICLANSFVDSPTIRFFSSDSAMSQALLRSFLYDCTYLQRLLKNPRQEFNFQGYYTSVDLENSALSEDALIQFGGLLERVSTISDNYVSYDSVVIPRTFSNVTVSEEKWKDLIHSSISLEITLYVEGHSDWEEQVSLIPLKVRVPQR